MKSNSPILGLGTDIIEIERIKDSLAKFGASFYTKLFTQREIDYCLSHKDPAPYFAGRFAAKEAIAKALGCGFGKDLSWHDIEIVNNNLGKPEVLIKNNNQIIVSISHCRTYATATALLLNN
jgi:holo-[acyl-carrier protein] synthase